MSLGANEDGCEQAELVAAYALRALPAADIPAVEAHLATCSRCRLDLEALDPIVATLDTWSANILRPSTSLWDRVIARIEDDDPPIAKLANTPNVGPFEGELRVETRDVTSIAMRWDHDGRCLALDVDLAAGRARVSDDAETRTIAAWTP